MKIYTRKGDDGTTGLWYGGRRRKSDKRIDAYGLRVGALADLVVVDAVHVPEAVVARPPRRYVFRHGRLVARDGELVDRDGNAG